MALVVFLQEDEDVLSVCHDLKIFCETAPWIGSSQKMGSSTAWGLSDDFSRVSVTRSVDSNWSYLDSWRWPNLPKFTRRC